MTCLRLFFALIFLLKMNNINAQDLSTHQWENRLVLVLANDTDSA